MTADLSKVTKDALAADLAKSDDLLRRMVAEDRGRDADARAIDSCVKALDALSEASRNSRSSTISNYDAVSGGYFEPRPRTPVDRVLGYLRQRYGIADPAGERDALRSELDRTQRELETLRRRFSQVYEAVQS